LQILQLKLRFATFAGMLHVRQLGFIAGILLSGWAYTLNFMDINPGELRPWVAPFLILSITIFLAVRRVPVETLPFPNFVKGIKAALGVVVIGVVIFNIADYILLKWIKPGKLPAFQGALFYSWIMLAMGMLMSLVVAFVLCFRSPNPKR
jgi:hypothetical protein